MYIVQLFNMDCLFFSRVPYYLQVFSFVPFLTLQHQNINIVCLVFSSPHYLLSFCKLSLSNFRSLPLLYFFLLLSISSSLSLSFTLAFSFYIPPCLSISTSSSLSQPSPLSPPFLPPQLSLPPSLFRSLPCTSPCREFQFYCIYVMCIKLLITTNRIWKRFTAVYKYSLHGSNAVTYERCHWKTSQTHPHRVHTYMISDNYILCHLGIHIYTWLTSILLSQVQDF